MFKRLYLYYEQIRYADSNTRQFAKENWDFFCKMVTSFESKGIRIKGKRILDIGCGKTPWLTLLLHSYGAHSSGIDTEYVSINRGIGKYLKIMKMNGLERASKTLYWDLFYSRSYYQALQDQASFPLQYEGLDIKILDSSHYDFPDNEFDVVVSHEVFEHIRDMGSTLEELKRVMKPGGLTYIYIHLYPSISGGHHIAWKYPDENPSLRVPPWDHLRENLFPQIPSWINRFREQDYRQYFEAAGFEIVDWITYAIEGESLLTPEIKEELTDYSEEELLKKGIVVIARNPKY